MFSIYENHRVETVLGELKLFNMEPGAHVATSLHYDPRKPVQIIHKRGGEALYNTRECEFHAITLNSTPQVHPPEESALVKECSTFENPKNEIGEAAGNSCDDNEPPIVIEAMKEAIITQRDLQAYHKFLFL